MRGIFWEGRIYLFESGAYSGGRGRFWEVAYSSSKGGYILGGWNIVVEKGGIFWEGGVDSGRVAYSC